MTESDPSDTRNGVRLIDREELYDKIVRGDRFHLFEVLPEMYWRKHHLPGALSLPPDEVETIVPTRVPDKQDEIVLYCWNFTCPTSGRAAHTLAAMGYTNVREYADGKDDWIRSGLPLTNERATT